MKKRFAVYGTLKKGFHNHYLLEDATYIGATKTEPKFTMYSMGGFPAVVQEGDTSINIEIYETDDPLIISRVNQLEGCTGVPNHPDNWYNIMTIPTEYGDADMYIFDNQPNHNIVNSGNWE